jgi:NADP-dependent 3-hydroxy acid dehydrogenase YdfG
MLLSERNPDKRGWVLVTGASRGIGAAIASALHRDGFGVILWARDGVALKRLAEALDPTGERVCWAATDVGDAQAVARAVEATLGLARPLKGMVLNAGHGRWRALSDVTLEDWSTTLTGNLTGAFLTLQAALPSLDMAAGPIILGMLSDSAVCAFPNRAAYASAKAGLETLLQTTRREYRSRGVRVSQIYPSRVDTYFAGSHDSAEPGMRSDGLSAEQVAETVRWIFAMPDTVEIRKVELSSIKVTFGLEADLYADAS